MNRQIFKKLSVVFLAVALMFAVTACSNDDGSSGSSYYNIGGQVKDSTGSGIPDVTINFSGDYDSVTTDKNGLWKLKDVKGGTTVTVTPEKEGYTFESRDVPVTGDLTNINFTDGDSGATGNHTAAVDYIEKGSISTQDSNLTVENQTVIALRFEEDIRVVSGVNLKDAVTIEGLPEDSNFSVNLLEGDGNDGDDPEGDYLEDKDLIIRIDSRVASQLKVMIAADTFYRNDGDVENDRLSKIETKYLVLNDNNNLTTEQSVTIDDVNTIKNAEKVVAVNWNMKEDRMPKVKELFEELIAERDEADIIKIADRLKEDLNHVVAEEDTIVVRAENGETATYTIELADEFSNVKVTSDLAVNGNAKYNVDNSAEKISSGELELAWNTTVSELKSNLNLTSNLSNMKVVAIDADITPESFDNLAELSGELGEGNDDHVAAKLVVQAVNGDIKVYDVITAEPNHTTNVEAEKDITSNPNDDDVSYKVLDVDNEQNVVTLRSDLDDGSFKNNASKLLEGLEGATISEVTNDSFVVTAQDDYTTAEYEVKYAPGYKPQASVADETPYQLTVKFGELDESIENDVDYEDLKADILEDFTVMVDGNAAKVLDVDLEDRPESDVAYLKLDTKVVEGDEVTVAYTPDPADDAYFIYDDNRTVGFETQLVDNQVDAPNYVRMVKEVSDLYAGTGETSEGVGKDKITIELDDDIVAVGDTTEIAKDFKVQTTKDRDSSKISGDQSPEVTDVDVVNNNQVELTLDSKILATEKIEVYYQPDYVADMDVLADTDTVTDVFGVTGENVVRLFADGEGSDSTTGKSVPNNVEVPSIINAEIKDGEADNIYLEFANEVLVNDTKVVDINDWFEIEEDRELVGIASTSDSNIIKLELEEGVNEAAGDIDVTYAPKLRTGNDVPAGFLTDNNGNKILRNEVTAINNVESASFSEAYVDDNDDAGDADEGGTTADKVVVYFDENIEVTDKAEFSVTVDGADATINSVSKISPSAVTITLDSKVKADQEVEVSYAADESVNNLIDADEIDRNGNNTAEDVDVVTFTNEEVTNNVEAPEFASANIKDSERNTVYIKFTEILDYINSPDFNTTSYEDGPDASYEEEFADDNFAVMVDGAKNRVTNAELINASAGETYPQLKLALTNELVDDDQEVKLSYTADDYTNSELHDSQGNVVASFSNEAVINELETPDFESVAVYDDAPNVVEVMFDSPDNLDTATVINNSATITVKGTEVNIIDAAVTGTVPNQIVEYEVATPIETGFDTVEVEVGSDLIEDNDGDTVSQLSAPIEADNQVAGPEIEGAVIKDNASNKVTVTFDESLATDGETGLAGAHTTNYSNIEDDFVVKVKGEENLITDIVRGASSNELELNLKHKIAPGVQDVNLSYDASEDLADQYGNRATKNYDGLVINEVVSDTEVDYNATHKTTSSTTIEVIMTNPVAIEGDSTGLEMEVIDADGNRVPVTDVSTSNSIVEITLTEELTADQGDLTVYYAPTVKDNLVGAGTDTDPVKKFSADISNTL